MRIRLQLFRRTKVWFCLFFFEVPCKFVSYIVFHYIFSSQTRYILCFDFYFFLWTILVYVFFSYNNIVFFPFYCQFCLGITVKLLLCLFLVLDVCEILSSLALITHSWVILSILFQRHYKQALFCFRSTGRIFFIYFAVLFSSILLLVGYIKAENTFLVLYLYVRLQSGLDAILYYYFAVYWDFGRMYFFSFFCFQLYYHLLYNNTFFYFCFYIPRANTSIAGSFGNRRSWILAAGSWRSTFSFFIINAAQRKQLEVLA